MMQGTNMKTAPPDKVFFSPKINIMKQEIKSSTDSLTLPRIAIGIDRKFLIDLKLCLVGNFKSGRQ